MMTGQGPFGGVEMGGMFSILKVRRDQKPGNYTDPGWYRQPPGTRAFEWTGPLAEPLRPVMHEGTHHGHGGTPATPTAVTAAETEVQVRKPSARPYQPLTPTHSLER